MASEDIIMLVLHNATLTTCSTVIPFTLADDFFGILKFLLPFVKTPIFFAKSQIFFPVSLTFCYYFDKTQVSIGCHKFLVLFPSCIWDCRYNSLYSNGL